MSRDEDDYLTSEFFDVCGVETHVLKYSNEKSTVNEKQYLFLIIPGNG